MKKCMTTFSGYPGGRKEEAAKDLIKTPARSDYRKSCKRYVA